jgi:hypothetical protein
MSNRLLYDRTHRRERAAWGLAVAAGIVNCWRCEELIPPGTAWDLGHRHGQPSHPEHTTCNRSDGAKVGNARREPRSQRWY